MAKKDDYIRIRVTKEQKELFKEVAELKGTTMSEFVVVITEKFALQEIDKVKSYDNMEKRAESIDHKLSIARASMESRKTDRKSFLKFLKK